MALILGNTFDEHFEASFVDHFYAEAIIFIF